MDMCVYVCVRVGCSGVCVCAHVPEHPTEPVQGLLVLG